MSLREESLTLYALDERCDGTTDCPRARDCTACVAIVEGDYVSSMLLGEYRFRCLCCGYRFLGWEV